jgi:hypothetical protein
LSGGTKAIVYELPRFDVYPPMQVPLSVVSISQFMQGWVRGTMGLVKDYCRTTVRMNLHLRSMNLALLMMKDSPPIHRIDHYYGSNFKNWGKGSKLTLSGHDGRDAQYQIQISADFHGCRLDISGW